MLDLTKNYVLNFQLMRVASGFPGLRDGSEIDETPAKEEADCVIKQAFLMSSLFICKISFSAI
jgi:hypothetical protein